MEAINHYWAFDNGLKSLGIESGFVLLVL